MQSTSRQTRPSPRRRGSGHSLVHPWSRYERCRQFTSREHLAWITVSLDHLTPPSLSPSPSGHSALTSQKTTSAAARGLHSVVIAPKIISTQAAVTEPFLPMRSSIPETGFEIQASLRRSSSPSKIAVHRPALCPSLSASMVNQRCPVPTALPHQEPGPSHPRHRVSASGTLARAGRSLQGPGRVASQGQGAPPGRVRPAQRPGDRSGSSWPAHLWQ